MSLIPRALIFFLLICTVLPAAAQSVDGVLINADRMDRDMVKGIVRLVGHVQIVFHGQHLSCDQAEVNQKTQTLQAEGHVILTNEKVHLEGERIVFNYKQNTGYVFGGFVQSGKVVFEGDVIEKVGESRYVASNAAYTACDTCPPGWSFSGRVIDAEVGGYAHISRPIFRIAGVPVLILPSLIVPLKSARQSGFLVPSMDFSGRGGLAFGESYFWAIDRSRDLTATVRRYELLGYKLHGDYRYLLSESSRGRLASAWIRDRSFTKELGLKKSFDRWYVDYSHYYDLPGNYVHRMDIAHASDLRYARDFTDELKGHGDPALQDRMSVTKTTEDQFLAAGVTLYTNLLKSDALARNDDAVNRMPELRYSLKEVQLVERGPYFGFDIDYVNFARSQFNYDDLSYDSHGERIGLGSTIRGLGPNGEIVRDGAFNARKGPCPLDPSKTCLDLNRTGQRLDVRPTLTYPFQVARRFDVLPALSFRETQYRFYTQDKDQFNDNAARRYFQADLRVKTELSAVYGDLSNPNAKRWKHSIEPEIGYSQIPWMRRPNHPFFGAFQGLRYSRQYDSLSDADLTNDNTGVQFDYEDRTYERQAVDLVLTNRLTRKLMKNGSADYFTTALFRLSQSYDLNEARASANPNRGEPHPWSPLTALLNVRLDNFETYTTAVYNPYARVTNTSSRLRFLSTPQNFLQLSYTHNYLLTERDDVIPNSQTRNFGFGGGFYSSWVDAAGELSYSDLTHKIQSWSYTMNIRPPGHCWVITIEHQQVLGGDRRIRGSMAFDFGGENKKGKFN